MKYANAMSAMNSNHVDHSAAAGNRSASMAATRSAAALEDSSWFESSFELANGLLVCDLTETFSTELFQQTLGSAKR